MKPAAWVLCAWVLWATNQSASYFLPVGGHDSSAACEAEAKAKNLKELSRWEAEINRNIRVQPDGTVGSSASSMTGHYCLPDTVDPRAPKR